MNKLLNKNRKKELEVFFSTLKASRVLLVTGPSGCGKTAAVEEVLKKLNLQCEFETFDNVKDYEMYMTKFCKYSNVFRTGTDCGNGSNETTIRSQMQKIVVIKDSPFTLGYQEGANTFADSTLNYCRHVVLVFIITQTTAYNSFIHSVFRRIPHTEIQFKAIARTHVANALKIPGPRSVNSGFPILEKCEGDLRYAANIKQFLSISETPCEVEDVQVEMGLTSKKKKRKLTNQSNSLSSRNPNVKMEIDLRLDLFHVLGKILYAKRSDEPNPAAYNLPPHLSSFRRNTPKDDMFQVLDNITTAVEPSHLLMHLHANILTFLTANSSHDLDRMSSTLTYLSDASTFDRGGRGGEEKFTAYVGALGTFFANDNLITSEHSYYSFSSIEYISKVVKSENSDYVRESYVTDAPEWTFKSYLNDLYPLKKYFNGLKLGLTAKEDFCNKNSVDEWWLEEDDIIEE